MYSFASFGNLSNRLIFVLWFKQLELEMVNQNENYCLIAF